MSNILACNTQSSSYSYMQFSVAHPKLVCQLFTRSFYTLTVNGLLIVYIVLCLIHNVHCLHFRQILLLLYVHCDHSVHSTHYTDVADH